MLRAVLRFEFQTYTGRSCVFTSLSGNYLNGVSRYIDKATSNEEIPEVRATSDLLDMYIYIYTHLYIYIYSVCVPILIMYMHLYIHFRPSIDAGSEKQGARGTGPFGRSLRHTGIFRNSL